MSEIPSIVKKKLRNLNITERNPMKSSSMSANN